MSLTLRITTIASLITAGAALAATPHNAQARTKLYLCDPGIQASIMCLEGLYTCNFGNPASTCETLASAAGCGGIDFGEGSTCSNEPTACGELHPEAVICVKASS